MYSALLGSVDTRNGSETPLLDAKDVARCSRQNATPKRAVAESSSSANATRRLPDADTYGQSANGDAVTIPNGTIYENNAADLADT
jgi:hypothetical protein